jgi:hypothetical protein
MQFSKWRHFVKGISDSAKHIARTPRALAAFVLALVMTFSSVAFSNEAVFASTADTGFDETSFIPEHFQSDSGIVLVESRTPRTQEARLGSQVNIIDLNVSLATAPEEALLTHWQVLHNGNQVGSREFPNEEILGSRYLTREQKMMRPPRRLTFL